MNRLLASIAALAALLAVPAASGRTHAQQPNPRELYTKIEYMTPMRDGIKLYTAVYVPKGKPGKFPILLERTPYGAGPYGPDAYRFGHLGSIKFREAGYAFAYQDVRGLCHSEGEFNNDRPQLVNTVKPHDIDESTDSWDTVDYLVKHVPGNNGRVGLWGISYPGFYAGVGAINSHPALRAASPQAPVSDWFIGDDFHHNGALFLMDAIGFARFGEHGGVGANLPRLSTAGDPFKFYLENGTLAGLTEKYFSTTNGLWHFLMEHGTYDEYWQARSLPVHMRNVRCPVMVVGGWFDAEDCWGALHTAKATRAQNPTTPTTLVMGPWYHGMWAGRGGDRFGDLQFGQPTSQYYQDNVEFPFFDACLRGTGKPTLPGAVVFETGVNKWHTYATWPPKEAKDQSLYLIGGGKLGIGAKQAGGQEYEEYVSDPADPVPYQGGTIRGRTREYMIDDQRFAAKRPDVLTYQSGALTKPLTIAGPLTADLWASTTGTDADFIVKVIDVYPDSAPGKMAGYQNLLRGEVMRAKFRDSYQNPQPLVPGQPTHVAWEMTDLLHTFQPGHRIMVQVQSSWFPLVDRNPQKFVDIYHCKPEDFQKATIRIYHTLEHASRVRVGVLPR